MTKEPYTVLQNPDKPGSYVILPYSIYQISAVMGWWEALTDEERRKNAVEMLIELSERRAQ